MTNKLQGLSSFFTRKSYADNPAYAYLRTSLLPELLGRETAVDRPDWNAVWKMDDPPTDRTPSPLTHFQTQKDHAGAAKNFVGRGPDVSESTPIMSLPMQSRIKRLPSKASLRQAGKEGKTEARLRW
jgi:hypothetical protein